MDLALVWKVILESCPLEAQVLCYVRGTRMRPAHMRLRLLWARFCRGIGVRAHTPVADLYIVGRTRALLPSKMHVHELRERAIPCALSRRSAHVIGTDEPQNIPYATSRKGPMDKLLGV